MKNDHEKPGRFCPGFSFIQLKKHFWKHVKGLNHETEIFLKQFRDIFNKEA